MKLLIKIICAFIFISPAYAYKLNKENIQQFMQNNAVGNSPNLVSKTYTGCELITATDFMQKLLIGFEGTGRACILEVHADKTVSLNLIAEKNIHLAPLPKSYQSNIYIGALKNGEVVIVDQAQGIIRSLTHTSYDQDGVLNFGKQGKGDAFRDCLFIKPSFVKEGENWCKKRGE